MKLHEIIKANEDDKSSILIELLIPYKKSLLTYYREQFNSEPMLMVTDVFNDAQYGKIVPSCELYDAIMLYLDEDLSEEDEENAIEEMWYNSILLSNL